MAFYRYTMLMQFKKTAPPAGFSESWENQEASDAAARNQFQTLITARRGCLSSDWQILSGRISKLSVFTPPPPPTPPVPRIKQSLVQPLTCPAGTDGQLGASDTPWSAVLIEMGKFTSTTFPTMRPRYQQLRGIPDTWWSAAALNIPAADQAAMQTFFSYLVTLGQFGQAKVTPTPSLEFVRYRGICLKRISSRRIGRPFGLLRGRQSREEPES